jgi:hypothetical protein
VRKYTCLERILEIKLHSRGFPAVHQFEFIFHFADIDSAQSAEFYNKGGPLSGAEASKE